MIKRIILRIILLCGWIISDQGENRITPSFKDLCRRAKHNLSKGVHTAKCQFYAKIITMSSSSKELLQIVGTLSGRRHVKKIPLFALVLTNAVFIMHFSDKIEHL